MRTVANHIKTNYNPQLMNEIKKLIVEGVREKALEDFIKKTIQGTEWQGKVFIAGGYVRDEFMGKDPKDLDLLVNAPNGGIEFAKWITKKVGCYKGSDAAWHQVGLEPEAPYLVGRLRGRAHSGTEEDQLPTDVMLRDKIWDEWRKAHDLWKSRYEYAEKSSAGGNPVVFPRFGTAKFNLRGVIHNGIDLSEMDVEAVMPRKEQYTAGTRKPTVTGGELKDDVERRDFTVNSLLKDLSTGEILDLTGMGKADIKAGIVRTPLNPDKIFTDDPLRMLRAIRFAVKYNWVLPLFMMRGLKKNAAQLKNISQERIRDELNKIIVTDSPDKGIKMLKITGLMPFVIPELLPLVKLMQNKYHKEDAFKHTLSVLKGTEPELVVRLMALFHDIGKAVTWSLDPKTGGVHFYGHEMAGERIAEEVMTRLKYPRELIDAVKMGVRHHMRMKSAGDEGVKISDKALLKFRNEMGVLLPKVLKLMHADNTAHADAAAMPNQIRNLEARIATLKDIPEKPKMPINGYDLQKILDLKPGPIFKEIMAAVLDAWYEDPSLDKNKALQIAKNIANIH